MSRSCCACVQKASPPKTIAVLRLGRSFERLTRVTRVALRVGSGRVGGVSRFLDTSTWPLDIAVNGWPLDVTFLDKPKNAKNTSLDTVLLRIKTNREENLHFQAAGSVLARSSLATKKRWTVRTFDDR